ncbi:hypothetical protein GCM10010483_08170 [Actinokineospora diospyrosa]
MLVAAVAVGAERTATVVAAATPTTAATTPAVLVVRLALRLDMSKPFPGSVVRSGSPPFWHSPNDHHGVPDRQMAGG